MIFTEKTIRVTNGQSQINDPVILYRGDRNIKLRFKIVDCPYTYSKTVHNVIESTEASYAQLVIQPPNNSFPIFSDIAATENGYVTFIITGEMIDEIPEVGSYTFQIRLLDDNMESRATLPEVKNGIEIREPIAIEDAAIIAVITYDEATQTLNVNEEAISYNEPTKTLNIKGLNL